MAARPRSGGVPIDPAASLEVAVPVQRTGTGAADSSRVGAEFPGGVIAGLDVAVALARVLYAASASAADRVGRRMAPLTRFLMHPPLLPVQLSPAAVLDRLAIRGRSDVEAVLPRMREVSIALTPQILAVVLDSLDVTQLVAERLDLNRLAAALDIDAIVKRVDVDGVVDRVDLDRVVERVDVDRVVDRVDIDRVIERVDLDRVAAQLDVEAILRRVDVDAVVARADPQAVLDRVDLVRIAREIIDELDLPTIIRESSGFLATDAVQGIRARSQSADDVVSSALSRLLPRRRRHISTEGPVDDDDA